MIHLSDIHIGKNEKKEFDRYNGLVRQIIDTEDASGSIVIITGDTCDNANDINYNDHPAALAIKALKDKGFDVLVIPGNHDYGTGGRDGANPKYIPLFKKTFYDDENISYPIILIYDNVVIVGLDSSGPYILNHTSKEARGTIGKEQADVIDAVFSQYPDKKKVVCLHHDPFSTDDHLLLSDWEDELKPAINDKDVILLYGHIHTDVNFGDLNKTDLQFNCILNAGSSTKTGEDGDHPEWSIFYRTIDISLASNPRSIKVVPDFNYTITVYTSDCEKAGTDAYVYITLAGVATTGPIELENKDKDDFEKGSIDSFVITANQDLGDIKQITIDAKSNGDKPGWLFTKIEVAPPHKLQNQFKTFTFTNDKWLLAEDKGNLTKLTLTSPTCE